VELKTTAFDFPDADGTYIQGNGHTGLRVPMRIFFWGDDYDLAANAFLEILLERGVFKLEHPIYGVIDVLPFGEVARRDDLKTAGNQAIFQVSFWQTTGLVYPTVQGDPGSAVLTAVQEYNAALAAEFQEGIELNSSVDEATLKNRYNALLGNMQGGLQAIADTQANVMQQFDTVIASINQGIDVLVGDPLTLAFQTTIALQAPARARTSILARLDAYRNLAAGIIGGAAPANKNEFLTNDLYAASYVTGSVVSTVNNDFFSKSEALSAADELLSQLADVIVWRDQNYQDLELIDTGASYQQLQEAVAIAAGFLVDISFSLKQERSIILDRDRALQDIVAELYGNVDDATIDFFITSNELTGSEIIELPRGRKIVYYV
jgi:prophage DNA circulation protein